MVLTKLDWVHGLFAIDVAMKAPRLHCVGDVLTLLIEVQSMWSPHSNFQWHNTKLMQYDSVTYQHLVCASGIATASTKLHCSNAYAVTSSTLWWYDGFIWHCGGGSAVVCAHTDPPRVV